MIEPFAFKGIICKTTYSYGIQVALLGKDDDVAYPIQSCKEYALDWTKIAINGLAIEKAVFLDEVRFVVTNLGDKVLNCIDFVNQFEKTINFPLSVVNSIADTAVVFRGSKRWFIAPPMLSLYTLLCRGGILHELGKTSQQTLSKFCERMLGERIQWTNSDHYSLTIARSTIETIIKHRPDTIFGTDLKKNWTTGKWHIHGCGIVSEWYTYLTK